MLPLEISLSRATKREHLPILHSQLNASQLFLKYILSLVVLQGIVPNLLSISGKLSITREVNLNIVGYKLKPISHWL